MLNQALASGLLERECIWRGGDLLHSMLCREPGSFLIGASEWWGPAESVQGYSGQVARWSAPRLSTAQDPRNPLPDLARDEAKHLVAITESLLKRPEVDPLRHSSLNVQAALRFVRPASSLQIALAANLVPVVELIGQWALTNGRVRDFQEQLFECDAQGQSPLHRAVASDRKHLVNYLLEQGARPNAKDAQGRPAIFHAKDVDVLDILLSAGADPEKTVGGRSLLEIWQSMDRKAHDSPYPVLISHLLSTGHGDAKEGLKAGAWMWLDRVSTRLGVADPAKLQRIQQGWEQGWKTEVVPALDGRPVHELSRVVRSGPLRGNTNFAAEMGFKWLKSDTGTDIWPSLLEDPKDAIAPKPSEIRKGLMDWGVLALGAARHLDSKLSLSLQSAHPQVSTALKVSKEKIARALEERAPGEEWETHLLQAAQVLQRPKNGPIWRDVSIALTAHTWNRTKGKDSMSLEVAEERLDFVLKALEAGTKWPAPGSKESARSPLGVLATTHTVIQASPHRDVSPVLFQKWTAVATVVLADTAFFNTFCAQEDQLQQAQYSRFIRETYAPMAQQSEGYLSLVPSPARRRVVDAFPLLEEWSPEVFWPVREAHMDQQVPQPSRASAPKSRF